MLVKKETQRKKEGEYQELKQSSTTPDLCYHMEKRQSTRNHHTQEGQGASTFPADDHKATRKRQDSLA